MITDGALITEKKDAIGTLLERKSQSDTHKKGLVVLQGPHVNRVIFQSGVGIKYFSRSSLTKIMATKLEELYV